MRVRGTPFGRMVPIMTVASVVMILTLEALVTSLTRELPITRWQAFDFRAYLPLRRFHDDPIPGTCAVDIVSALCQPRADGRLRGGRVLIHGRAEHVERPQGKGDPAREKSRGEDRRAGEEGRGKGRRNQG